MELHSDFESPFRIELSFEKLISDLEDIAAQPMHLKYSLAKNSLETFNANPWLRNHIIEASDLDENNDVISELLQDYFPPVLTQNEIKAVNIPYTNIFFNLSERFKNILKHAGPDFDLTIRDFDEHHMYVLSCCIILNEYYGQRFGLGKPIFYDIPAANGTMKHYRILYNADFLNVLPTENAVQLSEADISELVDNYDSIALWKEKFPPDSWILRGFAIMTLFDATIENAVSTLKEQLLASNVIDFKHTSNSIFQSIFQIPDLQVGFTAYNSDTAKFSSEVFGKQMHSYILGDLEELNATDALGTQAYNTLFINKRFFSVSNVAIRSACERMATCFSTQNIKSFILAPVFKNDLVLGLLEVVSFRSAELNSINAQKLEVVLPFLTNAIERLLIERENQIQAIIQENYTSIHKSVYWKFREEAKNVINNLLEETTYQPNEIVFEDVYPLYGQVDIKSSADIRNSCIQKDLLSQVDALMIVINKIVESEPGSGLRDSIGHLHDFKLRMNAPLTVDTEQQLQAYFLTDIDQQLKLVRNSDLTPIISNYFYECGKRTGLFYKHRRMFEESVSAINRSMSKIISKSQKNVQSRWPHYYESFKTDGIEHTIYAGASISKSTTFSIDQLYMLRRWQLQVMCEMEINYNAIRPNVPMPLDVRSLILSYHSPISIRFRMDEKRFDVDGSYNARFEIIKKRIDKALIKNTKERITQVGKIAIVYSTDAEEDEYTGYIQELKSAARLTGDIEKLDVEDLQGLSGLKVLRIAIAF